MTPLAPCSSSKPGPTVIRRCGHGTENRWATAFTSTKICSKTQVCRRNRLLMSASDHFILLSAMTLAYAVFGMTGFGAAMVAVPILVHILPLEFAVPLILLMDIVATVSVALKSRRHVVLAELRRLLPSLLVGVLLGAPIP